MSTTEDYLVNLIDHELKSRGFKRNGNDWYLGNDDCILVLNLQKSRFGKQFFINLGVYLRQLGSTKAPKEYDCHIRGRLGNLVPDIGIENALDLEDGSISSRERVELLSDSFGMVVLPFFDDMSTIESIRATLDAGKYPNLIIMLAAKRFLGI